MKRKVLLVCLAIGSVLTLTNCGKKGCTDSSAENFCSDCKKDDGSCTFKGQLVFCWNQSFHDSAVAHGVSSVAVYVNSTYMGALPVSGQVFSSLPSCGTSGALTVTQELGKNKTGSVSLYQNYLDGSGSILKTTGTANISMSSTTCTGVTLIWTWY